MSLLQGRESTSPERPEFVSVSLNDSEEGWLLSDYSDVGFDSDFPGFPTTTVELHFGV